LSRSSVKHLPEFRSVVSPGSRIGVCTTLPWQASLPPGEITMVVGRGAYVGLAPNPAGELNVAAAVDPSVLRGLPIGGVIRSILHDVGVLESVSLDDAEWHGTPALTSHPGLVAGERLFGVGDASGYVEPFSGEGMATALVTAAAVAPLVVEAICHWQPGLIYEWQSIHRQLVTNQQTTLRVLTWLLRKPRVAAAAVGVCRLQPWIAKRVAAKVSA
jgi:flavin-dependent dehydrogenase